MKRSRLWIAAWMPLALAACGGGDEKAEGEGATMDSVAAATPSVTATPPAAGTDTAAMGHSGNSTVQLAALNNSGVTGSAMLATEGGGTKVTLDLTGFKGAGTSAAHIHQGTCENLGAPVAPLTPVQVDESGNGSSITTVQVPMTTVMNGQHVVSAHELNGNPGAPVTCGAITGHSM